MCNDSNKGNNCSCTAEILKTIYILQENAEHSDGCLDSCDKGFLGCSCAPIYCNTRPIMLYTCCGNGIAWSMPINRENPTAGDEGIRSNVFRLEKIDGCCATFRVLCPKVEDNSESDFMSTNTFFTMDLNCCCAIRCLKDTFICL